MAQMGQHQLFGAVAQRRDGVVRDGGAYRVGAYVVYGDGFGCNGVGRLRRSGERLDIDEYRDTRRRYWYDR